MTTPTVTEITRRTDAVVHDTFIDDLRAPRPIASTAPTGDRRPGSRTVH